LRRINNRYYQHHFSYDTVGTALKGRISNMVTLNVPQSQPSANLKVTILLENLPSGCYVASVFELPDCRVEAETREEAITKIKAAFLERLKHIETISWDVPVQSSEPAWMKFAGVFKDDSDFQEIMQMIRAERNSNDESEVDPSYYL
jgi:predicted RNase H-like HicB family nuclease